jgi:hypothetical protein
MSAQAVPGGGSFAADPMRTDTMRRLAVSVSLLICIVGSMIGVGVFGGTPIAQAAGGALSSSATLLAPASPAFNIWTVIYAGLVAYAVWQWLPSQRRRERHRSLGWLVAASMLLNAGWILSIQAGWLNFSVLVIAVLLAVLAMVFTRYVRRPADGWIDRLVVDGTLGLYLGWVCVAVCANIAAALSAAGFTGFGIPAGVWASSVLAVVAVVGGGLAAAGRGRWAVAAAIVWGLGWMAAARVTGELESTTTAVAAGVAACAVLGATVVVRLSGVTRRERMTTNSESAG